jgi:hypothetical protein
VTDKIMPKTQIIDFLMQEEIKTIEEDFAHEDAKFIKKMISERKKELTKLEQKQLEALLPEEMYQEKFYESAKKEYYRLLAEKLGYSDADDDGLYEDPRDRGHRLEDEAAEFLERELAIKTVKVGMCVRDDYEDIAVSPDRLIAVDIDAETVVYIGAVEIKNPGVVNHLEIIFTNKIPDEYWDQVIQYFVVTDIEYLYFVSHNPNVRDKPLHVIQVYRKDIVSEIAESLESQIEVLRHLDEDVLKLSF